MLQVALLLPESGQPSLYAQLLLHTLISSAWSQRAWSLNSWCLAWSAVMPWCQRWPSSSAVGLYHLCSFETKHFDTIFPSWMMPYDGWSGILDPGLHLFGCWILTSDPEIRYVGRFYSLSGQEQIHWCLHETLSNLNSFVLPVRMTDCFLWSGFIAIFIFFGEMRFWKISELFRQSDGLVRWQGLGCMSFPVSSGPAWRRRFSVLGGQKGEVQTVLLSVIEQVFEQIQSPADWTASDDHESFVLFKQLDWHCASTAHLRWHFDTSPNPIYL